MEYKDKLLKEKIDSMEQSDRIEYITIRNDRRIRDMLALILGFFSLLMGGLYMIIGQFLVLLNTSDFIVVGVISLVLGGVFIIMSFGSCILIAFVDKKSQKELKHFIEEKTKSK